MDRESWPALWVSNSPHANLIAIRHPDAIPDHAAAIDETTDAADAAAKAQTGEIEVRI